MTQEKAYRPGVVEPIVSVIIVYVIMYIGYAGWLHWNNAHLTYQVEAMRMVRNMAPAWALQAMQDGGMTSTLTGMALVSGYREVFIVAGVVLGLAAVAAWRYVFPKEKPKPTTEKHHILKLTSPSIYVTVPTFSGDSPVAEQYLRLDRADIKLPHTPSTPIENLERAIIEILAAHRDYPSDPDGHHAGVPLFEHSMAVAKKMRNRAGEDPLARLLGLAHDFGKLVAYRKDPKAHNGWKIVAPAHDLMSANLVRLMPEYILLSEEDQRVLRFVLKYYHAPQMAPAQTPQRARVLIQKLRFADSLVTGENQRSASTQVSNDNVIKIVAETLLEVIPNLNINRIRDANADGFTGVAYDFCAVLEYPLRLGLSTHLQNERIVQSLALRTDKDKGTEHPATTVILKALKSTGLLIESYNGVTPLNGRFEIKSNTSTFRDVFLLDRGKLEKLYPEQVKQWGDKPPYGKLSVKTGTNRGAAQKPAPAQSPA